MTGLLHRLRWYKNRIAAMSAAEILFRSREFARHKIDRFYPQRLITPLPDAASLPEIPGLRAGLEAWPVPQTLLNQWSEDAEAAQSGALLLLGQKMSPAASAKKWHQDPATGSFWPDNEFCFAIDYRHDPADRDIKYVWELNRLQYLQPVAALACKKKDARLAQFCLDEIESWIDNNPPFCGVNWNSGIELALRAVSMLVVTSLTCEHASPALRDKMMASLRTHAVWIARYPSRYSSANNHCVAEALGLFMIGVLCPHFKEAAIWRETGWKILCEAARRQILPDGAGAEQSVAYTAAALEMLLAGFVIAKSHALPVPDFYLRKLILGGEYLRWLTDESGHLPHIGDDDNACVFGFYHRGDAYASGILSSIAAISGRADLAPPRTQAHFRQAIFGSPPAPDFAPYGVRGFAHGGMTIGRHKREKGDILVAFDHGYLGYLSIAAHGHADTLSVWLHLGDQPVLVDAGTYAYHSNPEMRRAFRGTAAHNTLTLDGEDSSSMSGNFNWSRKAEATLRSFEQQGDAWRIEGEHDGYVENFQTIHRRHLNVLPATGAIIEDEIISAAPRQVALAFLLHPNLTARRDGDDIVILKEDKILLRLHHESALEAIIGAPDTRDGGCYSPEFGVRQAATRLVFKGTLQPNAKAVTRLFWVD